MFRKRTAFATNGELLNQHSVNNIIMAHNLPHSMIERKAAAIYGHPSIDSILHAKVFNNLQSILAIMERAVAVENSKLTETDDIEMHTIDPNNMESLATTILTIPSVHTYVWSLLQSVPEIVTPVRKKDVSKIHITIPKKLSVKTIVPDPILDKHREYEAILSDWVRPSKLSEFEYLCFNNRTQFRYMGNTNFATYMYQNILYYLQIDDTSLAALSLPCANDDATVPWQQKFAQLIQRINFNNTLVEQAFYDNTIQYRNITHDTSYVPKYDVRAMEPHQPIEHGVVNDSELIAYHENLNVRTVENVPANKIAIFLALPFKDGHLIKPCGRIVRINLLTQTTRRSSRIIMQDLCNIYDLENAVENVARVLPLMHVVWHAVNASSLKIQALALLVLRRLLGNELTIDGHTIVLADELQILSWLQWTCSSRSVVLPPVYPGIPRKMVDTCVQMIRDIVASCCSRRGASFLCSTYGIHEMLMGNVYAELKTDSEKYVFYTLILQEYPIQMYADIREKLTDIQFGCKTIDLRSIYEPFHRAYINSVVGDRVNLSSESVLRPDEVNSDVVLCNPVDCAESYEYENEQLNALVRDEPLNMDPHQISNFIVLLLNKSKPK